MRNSAVKHTCAGTAQSQSAPQSSDEGVSVGLGSDHKPESQLSVIQSRFAKLNLSQTPAILDSH